MRLDDHGEPLVLNIGVFLGFENAYGVRNKFIWGQKLVIYSYECMLKQKIKGQAKTNGA